MTNKIENTIAVLGGAALGAAAMYLLDCTSAQSGLAGLGDTASDAVHSARRSMRDAVGGAAEGVHSAQHSMRDAIKAAVDAAVQKVHGAYDTASDAVHDTLHGARKAAESQSGRVGRYTGYAKKLAGKVAGRVGSAATDWASSLSDHAASVADHASHLSDRLSELAGNAADAAGDTLKSAGKTASGTTAAAMAANAASSAGSSYADRLRAEIMRNLTAVTDSATQVGDVADRHAKQVVRAAQKKAAHASGHESHPVATTVGLTTGGLALLAAGAVAMYYFDPARGHGRRAQTADQLFAFGRRTGKSARRFGRHMGNRLQGYAAETSGAVRSWQSPDVPQSFTETPSMPSPRPTM